eukprot:TRINITY_DN4262_c0_g1_i1.p1 TRINITY_DN4262_c0_g1~~TRINITY_DN4262_c0_g1_i1.p1  ORF type:complete len:100 (-),score=20.96 TRINITY_DN4262_c0_g1_i1:424-681(-)
MSGLFGRIFQQWAQQTLVPYLAQSRLFQKFATTTVKTVRTTSSKINQSASKLAEEADVNSKIRDVDVKKSWEKIINVIKEDLKKS